MIIIALMGGLGNQMFQYSLGRYLALMRNVPLKLDLSWFATQGKRRYELKYFQIKGEIVTEEETAKIFHISPNQFVRKFQKVFQILHSYENRDWIDGKRIKKFNPKILNSPNECILEGYWQSEKYFQPVSDQVKQDFTLQEPMPTETQTLSDRISSNPNSVSVHIRRGDYVTENIGHWVCPPDYFKRSIAYISKKIQSPQFYFFSDDITWARNNIKTDFSTTYIEPSGSDVVDMKLMSYCHHHINANSSFSWWGAWLGEQHDSIIIAPRKWFKKRSNPVDLVPDRWIRL